MTTRPLLLVLAAALPFLLIGCASSLHPSVDNAWRSKLRENLPRLGHRNFIVIADSAYPLQSASGIQTVYVGGSQAEALEEVLALLASQKHVRPIAWMDTELAGIAEADAPGIGKCRQDLAAVMQGVQLKTAPHMDIIKRLDESSKLFNVTILKTNETLPYTSVFLELDCGYWNTEKEKRLRAALKN